MTDTLGDRVKRYEAAYNPRLTPRTPVIIRVDGRAFHTYTRFANKPFDLGLINAMNFAARKTAEDMQGFKLAYVQSDECTFVLTDNDNLDTQGWFDYELNKIVSISASLFTTYFNQSTPFDKDAVFDSRAFNVPADDVANVFVWRQRDWERNSLQMFARSFFGQKQLHGKKTADMHEMLHQKGLNWANLSPLFKNGTFWTRDLNAVHEKLDYHSINELIYGWDGTVL